MDLLLAMLVFLGLTGVFALLGLNVWVWPKAAIDRVTASAADPQAQEVAHPSLAFRDLLKKLGTLVPASPKDTTIMQRRLIRAGFRNPNALKVLYGAKFVLALLIPVLTFGVIAGSSWESSSKIMATLASVAIGFFAPNEYVRTVATRRQKQIRRALPNALDLLVVSVESGLGLDQAIVQVAKELENAHPEITEEFSLMNLELKAGKRRIEALRNLAERTNVEDLRKLVAVLIQADRFGTSIAATLRNHAEFMRVQARQVAEEKAAKLGVKLVFPIFFCILPSLFVVTVGPMAFKIVRELLPMINSI
ncbi:MAG TPA: type II secretion system F family protein [Bryobacteraceae bacterium]|jgi:tight adherence protein C|nr:type II secretion system F family protein [Bryobacteraceae bacterium]